MGRTHYFEAFFRDGITVLLGLPGVVTIMVSLMIFGLSPWGRITSVGLGLIPLVAINVAEGARGIPKDLKDMASSYGVPRYRQLREIVWPSAAPHIFAGARYGLAVGFKATAMVEVFGGSRGMGFQLRSRFAEFSVAGVLAWTALIVAIVMLLELGILKPTERRVFRWRQSAFN
jgi:NitT/TauT family transport system permease protein